MSSIRLRFGLLGIVCLGLGACGGSSGPSTAVSSAALVGAPEGATVVQVNGEAISEPLLVVFAKGQGLDPTVPEQRKKALDLLIEHVLIAQDAAAKQLTTRPEVMAELALVRVQQLSGRGVAEFRKTTPITDDAVAQYYQQEAQRAGDTEFKVEHILFASEVEARVALDRALAADADFAALLAEYASRNAKQSKTLDWANGAQLPPELVVALKQLQNGQVAAAPVQSAFGWHVLRRAESRPFSPPPLDTVRDGARKQLTEAALREYVAGLRGKAKLEGLTP